MIERIRVMGAGGRVGSAVSARLAERGIALDGDEPELVLLCVPDRAIAEVAQPSTDGPWVAHVSGATPLAALDPHERRFGLHPLQSFSKSRGPEQLDGAWAAVTAGDGRGAALGFWLAETLGLHPFALDDANRAAYHAGAAVASNYLVTLRRAAGSLLEAAERPPEALDPLMRGVIESGFELTGPIARGDWETVARHLAAIRAERPDLEELYSCSRRRPPRSPAASCRVTRCHKRVERRADGLPHDSGLRMRARGRRSGSIGLVPTMGSLHEGHLSLLRAARAECDTVVMSLFVNPAQFADPADLGRYPRDDERDLALAGEVGVDLVFAPSADEMYPRRLPDLGRRDRARIDPRGRVPPRPLPGSGDDRPQAHLDRPPDPRLLRAEGRTAGRGDSPHDPGSRARRRAPRPPHGPRRGRARALLAQRPPLRRGAASAPLALARALATRDPVAARKLLAESNGLEVDYLEIATSTRPFSPAPSASARPASSTTSLSEGDTT